MSLHTPNFTFDQVGALQWESTQETPDRTSRNEETSGNIQRQPYVERMGVADSYNDTLKKEVTEMTNHQFSKLQTEINNLKYYISCMALNNDAMKARIDELESKNYTQSLICKELEEKIESFESNYKSTVIEIKNVPLKELEIKFDLIILVRIIGKVLELEIMPCEINDVYRIQAINNIHPFIIVKFSSIPLKEEFLKRSKKISKDNPYKIGSVLGSMGYDVTLVQISQYLLSKTKRLLTLANEFADTHGYSACWSSYGKVYLRKMDGGPHLHIKNEMHLDSLKYF